MRIFNSNYIHGSTIVSSQGPWLIAKDGFKIFDTWLGSGTLILGHCAGTDPAVPIDMLPDGPELDTTLFQNLEAAAGWPVGGLGFQTSGSSAIARACRLARAATGKEAIAVVKNFWHGSDDQFLFTGSDKTQISPGVPEGSQGCSHYFSSINQFLELATMANYAALLLEPYQGADPSTATLTSTISTWRETLRENSIFLIADEIITGFRERYGSCTVSRNYFPDILVFGKAIGNGYPVGVVLVATNVIKSVPDRLFWGGTFSASPTQIASVSNHLERLKKLDYSKLTDNLSNICHRVESIIQRKKFPLGIFKGCGFARIKEFTGNSQPRAFVNTKRSSFKDLQTDALKERIYLGNNGLMFPSVFNIEDYLL